MPQPLNTGNSLGTNFQQVNSLMTDFQNEQTTKIFKDDNGMRRVLLGKGNNGFYGLKVSKDGFDVYTATDAQLVFNSDQNTFKVTKTLTTSITAPASIGSTTLSVPHGLTFVPIVVAYVNNASQYIPLPVTFWGTTASKGSAEFALFISSVDATNVTFQLNNYNAVFNGTVYPIKIYLQQETAN